jgi:hypothetical protein
MMINKIIKKLILINVYLNMNITFFKDKTRSLSEVSEVGLWESNKNINNNK